MSKNMRESDDFAMRELHAVRTQCPVLEDMRCLDPNATAEVEQVILTKSKALFITMQDVRNLRRSNMSLNLEKVAHKDKLESLRRTKNHECFWSSIVAFLVGACITGLLILAVAS